MNNTTLSNELLLMNGTTVSPYYDYSANNATTLSLSLNISSTPTATPTLSPVTTPIPDRTITPLDSISLITLFGVELLGHLLLECPSSALNFYLIFSTSVLHPNLKFILLCQSTCIFTRGIGRTWILFTRLCTGDTKYLGPLPLQYVLSIAIYVRNQLAHVLVAERAMATIWVKRYEQWRKPYFTVAWITLLASLVVVSAISTTSNAVVNWILSGVSPLLCLLECAALYWLWHHNDKLYQNRFFKVHNLNERYQLAENIRTAKQLTPTLLLHFLSIFMNAMLSWLSIFAVFDHQFYYTLANQLVFTLATYNNFLIELAMIVYHPFLRRSLNKMWGNVWRRLSPKRVGATDQKGGWVAMRDMKGGELVRKQGQDEHFLQLNAAWGRGGEAENAGGGGGGRQQQKRWKTKKTQL